MRNIHILAVWLIFSLPLTTLAQVNHGFSYDNYGGIYGLIANPANSAESKHKFHINVLSYNRWNVADFGGVDLLDIEKNPTGFNGLDFSQNPEEATKNNVMSSNSDVMLPSILWGFHEKHAVGLLMRSRTFSDYQNFDGNLWAQLNQEETTGGVSGQSTFNNTIHHWDEIGLNYAMVLFNTNYHFLKFGGTIKYLLGRGGVELSGRVNANELGDTVTDVNFKYLNTFDNDLDRSDEPNPAMALSNAFDIQMNGAGVGGDLGFVYEWRPRETNRVGVRNSSSGVNTYKLRISASILDIGTVNYAGVDNGKDNIRRRTFTVAEQNSSISTANVTEFLNTLDDANANENNTEQGSVSFSLPRSLNIGLDYIILNDKNYYINLNYTKGLTTVDEEFANTRLDLITLTPRYETRDFSAYLPVSYQQNTGIHVGLGVRYKYLTAGCAALSSPIQDRPLNHIYVGVSIPILEEIFQ